MEINIIIETSSFRETQNNQIEIVQLKDVSDIKHAENGGIFVVDKELITFVDYLVRKNQFSIFLLDSRNIPIKIDEPQKFLDNITDTFMKSTLKYYYDYSELKTKRNNFSIIGMKDEQRNNT